MTSRAPESTADLPVTDQRLFLELGGPGPRRVGKQLYDDFLPQLRGSKASQVYREMMDNDSDIASLLFSITMISREVDWHVEQGDSTPEAAGFLEENIEGLDHAWEDVIADALTALPFGWSFQEVQYDPDDRTPPRWLRFGLRPQDSVLDWILDDNNRPLGLRQEPAVGGTPVPIPLSKGLYFRTDTTKPEGRSVLRPAYRSWFFKKRAEELLMIGVERNLIGLPYAWVPAEVLARGAGDPQYDTIQKIVTRTKVDEQQGVMFPSDLWPNTQNSKMYEFGLLHPDGSPNFNQAIAVVRMWAMNMISTVLAQWQGLGRDAVGSRALAEPLQSLFLTAINAWLDQLEETINRQIVRQLFRVQPTSPEILPRLIHGDVEKVDPAKIATAAKDLAQAGAVFSEAQLEQLVQSIGLDRDDELGQVSKAKLDGFRKQLDHVDYD